MSAVTPITRPLRDSTLRIVEESKRDVFWMYMHSHHSKQQRRTCFSSEMLDDMLQFQAIVRQRAAQHRSTCSFTILASDSDVFNLGGDLAAFNQLIRKRDRNALLDYAKRCVLCVHGFHYGCHAGAHSIALVEGTALGGGLELALSCNTVIAEEGVTMGFPEVMFNLFPGMGAYSFMRQRISLHRAEQIMSEGKTYRAEEMYEMGLIDHLTPRGKGRQKVEQVINHAQRIANAWQAIQRAKLFTSPVTHDELMGITEVWVDAAMQLGDKALRTMERLVYAQNRRIGITQVL